MTVLIFIVMLVALIVAHEFGHFIVGKLSGMKIPEFGIGFPPKLWGKKIGDTEYTVNALPFGGFVRIEGEDASERSDDPAAFSNRPKLLQAATLVAGPFANILLAFILLSAAFMAGVPYAEEEGGPAVEDARVVVASILPGSPAAEAGLKVGDTVVSVAVNGVTTGIEKPEDIAAIVAGTESEITVVADRADETVLFTMTPEKGIIAEKPDVPAIGVASTRVGTLKLPFFEAIGKGFAETGHDIVRVAEGMGHLIVSAVTLSADVENVAGPVGIASLTGEAASFGFGALLSFAALISINLGVLNLLPFPALDGGRLFFLIVETVSRKPFPPKLARTLNFAGFALLILLMLAVTAHDIFRLVS